MKAFSALTNKLGIDLGSSQVRIFRDDRVVLEESSVAVVDNINGRVLGFGTDALIRYHEEPENHYLAWPVKNGSIADYNIAKSMLRYFINKALHHSVSRPSVMIAVPCETSSVARHALVDALMHAGARQVYLIASPAAAAIGADFNLENSSTILSMVIGRDVTNVGLYCCGGIVSQVGDAFGGHNIDVGICQYLQDKYNVLIGIEQAEKLKSEVISLTRGGNQDTFTIRGRRISDGVEVVIELSLEELSPVMKQIMKPVVSSVKRARAEAPPEMAGDLLKNGLLLSGGSALLSGLKDWLSFELGIPVLVPDNPADIISEGCLKAFDKQKHLSLLIENGEKYYGGA